MYIFLVVDASVLRESAWTNYLQFVLVIGVGVRQQSELLGKAEAVVQVFRGHKVLGDLDTAVEVLDLVGCPRGDEDGVPHTLDDGVAQDPVLLIQTIL